MVGHAIRHTTDLRERLERYGLVLAGDAAMMARLGFDQLDIPINPDLQVEFVDGTDETLIDAMGVITQVCFNWTDEQVAENRPGMIERLRDPKFREKDSSFLARLDGQPVAYGRLLLEGGLAYLGGSGVLPEGAEATRSTRPCCAVVWRKRRRAGTTWLPSTLNLCHVPSWRGMGSKNMRELTSMAGCPSSTWK